MCVRATTEQSRPCVPSIQISSTIQEQTVQPPATPIATHENSIQIPTSNKEQAAQFIPIATNQKSTQHNLEKDHQTTLELFKVDATTQHVSQSWKNLQRFHHRWTDSIQYDDKITYTSVINEISDLETALLNSNLERKKIVG